MPQSAFRACNRCGSLHRGRCPTCSKAYDEKRGTTAERGYGAAWQHFRNQQFPALLLDAGILPHCGAALPDGPQMDASECKAQGRTETRSLQLHHEPSLLAWERKHVDRVCDPTRVGFLCASCHSKRTLAEIKQQDASAWRIA